jgi:hypothetical protein
MIDLIVVHRRDVEAMTELLRPAMLEAEEKWIPANAIAEALVEALHALTARLGDPGATADYLRALADEVDAEPRVAERAN